jgi:polysaccharide chain length determinant protein (PEP-CTERM system associated)
MVSSPAFDIKNLANLFYLKKEKIITVFLVVFSLGAYLALSLPDIYRSSSVILLTPQQLPAFYVHSPVTATIDQRIRATSEAILGRTRLQQVVEELNLYPTLTGIDSRIAKLRRNIQIEVRRNDTFAISFDHAVPEIAKLVADRLGSLFVNENLEKREQLATGTTTFLNMELDRLRKDLEREEAAVNLFKAQHRFELPEQLDANLRTSEQLRAQLQGNTLRLSTLHERKASLAKQLTESQYMVSGVGRSNSAEGQQGVSGWRTVEDRKLQLEDLLTRYSEKHPDVVRLKNEIQSLEAEAKNQSQTKGSVATPLVRNPVQQMLLKQIEDLNLEINTTEAANDVLRKQIASYQARIDNTPMRAIEVAKISRGYDSTLKKYQELQGKSHESQLSENMEKKQKGEQFQVVDKANLPQAPAAPNRLLIILVAFGAGLAGAFGLVFLQDNLDTSFKRAEELREYSDVPLLATIPAVSSRGSILEQRRSQRILVFVSGLGLVVGIVSIHFLSPLFF